MVGENFAIVLLVLGIAAALGFGSMIWAYQGAGSIAVLFLEVIPAPDRLTDTSLRRNFDIGVAEYCKGYYRRSAKYFAQVIQADSTLAEAHHNYALSLANQREDDKATAAFLQAAQYYSEVEDLDSKDLVKQHLIALRQRKRDRGVKRV